MIDAIVMNKIAVYSQKTELSHCRKINLIYGNNGTGKTLLSNYLTNPANPIYADCSIQWDQDGPLPIYGFNKKFCDDNFRGTSIPGIFTLGHENVNNENKTVTIESEISSNKQNLHQLRETYESLDKRKTIQQDICIESLWNRVRTYKQLLGDYFAKPISKTQCFERVRAAYSSDSCNVPGLFDLKRKVDVLNAQPEVQYPSYNFFDVSLLSSVEENPVWNETIQHDDFSETDQNKKDGNLMNWIHQGLRYVNEKKLCPFCEQKIPESRLSETMRNLSSDGYSQKTDLCSRLLTQYETLVQRFLSGAERILKENRDEGAAFLDTNRFADVLTNLTNLFHANLLFMQRKKDNFSQAVSIRSCRELASVLNQLIDESNTHASQANALLQNLRKSKAELKEASRASFYAESRNDIRDYNAAVYGVELELNQVMAQIHETEEAIRGLESEREKILRNSVNIRESVERINDELTSLGVDAFRLQLSEDEHQYRIVREDGSDAGETLSEGEKTLIMLLYFLRLIEGSSSKENVKGERVIVIDDPVANLDDIALNAVLDRIGSLISKILDGDPYIRQLFVLSHRKECTKKLRACDQRLENEDLASLWILKKQNGITCAQKFAAG